MILLDTAVLVYAVGADHPLREPCREIIAAVTDGHLRGTTTIEVLQEFTHVRSRRHGRESAAHRASEFAELLAPLISTDAEDLRVGLGLFDRHERIGAFDAVLAAAAMNRPHITALVSADRAFADIRGIRHLNPASDDVVALAGG